MKKSASLLQGMAIGAALMYLLDPTSGQRRRALLSDKLVNARVKTQDKMGKAARHIKNRASGFAANARAAFAGDPVSDHDLIGHIRSRIGHISDISQLHVSVEGGDVILSGTIDPSFVTRIVERVQATRGVVTIENRLNAH